MRLSKFCVAFEWNGRVYEGRLGSIETDAPYISLVDYGTFGNGFTRTVACFGSNIGDAPLSRLKPRTQAARDLLAVVS